MTNGQVAKLQDLSKCYMADLWDIVDFDSLQIRSSEVVMNKAEKAALRRLWHQYRHQIAAMRKNRRKSIGDKHA